MKGHKRTNFYTIRKTNKGKTTNKKLFFQIATKRQQQNDISITRIEKKLKTAK